MTTGAMSQCLLMVMMVSILGYNNTVRDLWKSLLHYMGPLLQ